MCGILAAFGEISTPLAASLPGAIRSLAHRGPDAEGILQFRRAWLGHRRLAILDLSAFGNQPLVDANSGLAITYNGEIYNYIELRSTLEQLGHSFATKTDTEVILKGYLEWGNTLPQRLNGMWAFCIWDPKTETAFVSRDRFGVKPLYYHLDGSRIVLASEPKALHRVIPRTMNISTAAVAEFMVFSRAHDGEKTFYDEITSLPPAHYAIYDVNSGDFQKHRYWNYPSIDSNSCSTDNPDGLFSDILTDAVRIRLRSDVSVGLTLSGGLDSTAILAALEPSTARKTICYTSTYEGKLLGELSWAKIAAEQAGAELTPVVTPLETWLEKQNLIAHHMDAPGLSPAVIPTWEIMREARVGGVPVLLEGQGADEIFGGYDHYKAIGPLSALDSLHVGSFLKQASAGISELGYRQFGISLGRSLSPKFADSLQRLSRNSWLTPKAQHALQGASAAVASPYPKDRWRSLLWLDHSSRILPALLHYGDAISMAHGIESRQPFMDYRMVEWAFKNAENADSRSPSKLPIRQYLHQRAFHQTAKRDDKLGYPVPTSDWISRFGYRYFKEILSRPSAPIWEYLEPRAVSSELEDLGRNSATRAFNLYKVFSLSVWLDCISARRSEVSRSLGE